MKLVITAIFAIAITTMGFGQITGTLHDFSAQTWAQNDNGDGEICIACHTPHNAVLTVTDAPLWNHLVTTETFQVYDLSPTMSQTPGQPAGTSKLCLSCHDGTTNLDAVGVDGTGTPIAGTAPMGAIAANLGLNLRAHHPISFDYTAAAVADADINVETTAIAGGGTISSQLLFGTQMECASCHDVHNQGAGPVNLLTYDNAGSALCLICHDK